MISALAAECVAWCTWPGQRPTDLWDAHLAPCFTGACQFRLGRLLAGP